MPRLGTAGLCRHNVQGHVHTMKFTSITARDWRALVIAAWVIIPGVLVRCIGQPYLQTLSALREATADARDRLREEQRAIAGLPMLPVARRAAQQRLGAEEERLFSGNDDLLATATLAQYVAVIAQENGLQLRASETGPARVVIPGLQALQVDVRGEGDLDGILHLLHQLETGGKLTRVGSLTVISDARSSNAQTRAGSLVNQTVGGDRDDPLQARSIQNVEVLSFSATVYGYRFTDRQQIAGETSEIGGPSPFILTTASQDALNSVLEHDLFNPLRTAPATLYRTAVLDAAQRRTSQAGAALRPYQQPNLHVVGIVAGEGDDSFMLCQNGNTPLQTVHIGEAIAGYTLSTLDRDAAVLTGPGGVHMIVQLQQEGLQPSESNRLRRHHHFAGGAVGGNG